MRSLGGDVCQIHALDRLLARFVSCDEAAHCEPSDSNNGVKWHIVPKLSAGYWAAHQFQARIRLAARHCRNPWARELNPAAVLARENAIYFRPMSAVWPMTSTLNLALAAVLALGLFAVALAVMVW